MPTSDPAGRFSECLFRHLESIFIEHLTVTLEIVGIADAVRVYGDRALVGQ